VSEDAVLEAVQALASAGEYLDDIPGSESPSGRRGGLFRTADGRLRRIYRRGSPEYLQAREDGLIEPLPALATAPAATVDEAENVIGFELPPLLRRLYLEVGNGGFGPGYGILGLTGGHRDDLRMTALDHYRQAHTPASRWSFINPGLLPVCYRGCAIYSFVDCTRPEGPMWGWDPNSGPQDQHALYAQQVTLAEWLSRWVTGTLYQPALVQDPITRQWRGATDEEYTQWMAGLDEPG
jgi:hypothetical protein